MKYFFCNWKMNLDLLASSLLAKEVLTLKTNDQIILAPSHPNLYPVADIIRKSNIKLCAQDCSKFEKGSYTGEVSAPMISSIGCEYVIIGHSERRKHFCETLEEIITKASLALKNNLTPVICIGEELAIYEQGKTLEFIRNKISALEAIDLSKTIIAYEPVWSIGTGLIPKNEEIESVVSLIKKLASPIAVLYGGSVDSNNSQNILQISSLDGFLIGGASQKFSELKKIIAVAH